jgi:bifunctional DNA-binding transcriptional regulator/antitoxin component of YhaV-PrlF toxin-antitoxin module
MCESKLTKTMSAQVQKVLSGGRITISEDARDTLNIKDGDYVILKIQKGVLQVIPANVSPRERDHKK